MPRWLIILFALIFGVVLGLIYGLALDPVHFTDITPDALRIDYRTDYVLMVAEAYRAEQDPAVAARRLALLGSESPTVITEETYNFARQAGYSPEDITLIQDLAVALQTWQPIPGSSLP